MIQITYCMENWRGTLAYQYLPSYIHSCIYFIRSQRSYLLFRTKNMCFILGLFVNFSLGTYFDILDNSRAKEGMTRMNFTASLLYINCDVHNHYALRRHFLLFLALLLISPLLSLDAIPRRAPPVKEVEGVGPTISGGMPVALRSVSVTIFWQLPT